MGEVLNSGMRVIVIGGGVIGCLTAWRLQQLGAEPVVLERSVLGRESSWAGAGILSPINPWLYPDSFTHLVDASLALYPSLSQELASESGMSIEWHKSGLMVPLFHDDVVNHESQAVAWSKKFGWQLERLGHAQALEYEPALSSDVRGALLWPEVAQVRNPRLLQAVQKAMQNRGIEIREQAEVVGLHEANGAVQGVRLRGGEVVAGDAVLLAAGSWSGELSRAMGFEIPIEPVKGQLVLLKAKPGLLRHIVKHDRAYFVPRADGRILVGASMEKVGFEPGNTEEVVQALLDAMVRIAPGLKEAEIERQWMGFRPGSPDGLPYLGPVEGKPGLWVASGHYRNGVVLAPGTARVMSHWIMGREPELDLQDFRVSRQQVSSRSIGFPEG